MGTAHCRIHIDALTDERSKHWNWKNTGSIELNLSEKNKTDISRGADHILAQTQIKASDWHYDAKIWPHMHPYGTGSAFCEVGSGALSRLVRNRLLLIQSCFRNNSLYAFWFLHRLITKELFFRETRKPAVQMTQIPSQDYMERSCPRIYQKVALGGSLRTHYRKHP